MNTLKISKLNIEDNSKNEVTSEKVFTPRRAVTVDGTPTFDENGIFSTKIFGKFGKCNCDKQTTFGICEYCNTRVIHKNSIPDFYISFAGLLDIPDILLEEIDFTDDIKLVKNLMHYKGFLYDNVYTEYNLQELDLSKFDVSKVLFGKEAILSLGGTEEWYNKYTSDKLFIPHPKYRQITKREDNKYFLGQLNVAYVDILKVKRKLLENIKLGYIDKFNILSQCSRLMKLINTAREELYKIFFKNNRHIVDEELTGQKITSMTRGVITNNFDLNEDVSIIGKTFIKTLYPKLYEKFYDKNNKYLDIYSLNKYLIDNEYYCLLNRQPTIGAKSIVGIVPQFSDKEIDKYVNQLNPIIFDGLAGDTDGDVLSITALYSKEARKEAKKLLPSVNYIEGSNGSIRNGLPEDFVYALQKIYNEKSSGYKEIKNLLNCSLDTNFEHDFNILNTVSRDIYIDIYRIIGDNMYNTCYTPNVGDFALAFGDDKDSKALEKIKHITNFTNNYDDIVKSINRKSCNYNEEESVKFLSSVVAANVTDITESGYFYKKLIASTDNMYIDKELKDCKSEGDLIDLPVDKNTYDFKIRFRYINELQEYTEDYRDFVEKTKRLNSVHIRTFLTCNCSKNHRTFCKTCAGLYKRNHEDNFVPYNIGVYSTLMITEHATQASLDSMNKGESVKMNVALEQKINSKQLKNYDMVKDKIKQIINDIGNIGVESRFYEIALLSRMYKKSSDVYNASGLAYSINKQGDLFGSFIYRPTQKSLNDMLKSKKIPLTSMKSKIALDLFE